MRNSEADKRRITLIIKIINFPTMEITGLKWQREMVTVSGSRISLLSVRYLVNILEVSCKQELVHPLRNLFSQIRSQVHITGD